VSTVFFLFLTHQALGLMLALGFVTDRAGDRFFRFSSAAAAFMATGALALLLRRFGWSGAGAPFGDAYTAVVAVSLMAVSGMIVYNRAWYFDWHRLQSPSLAFTLAAGGAAVVLAAPASARALVVASSLSSILLLGAAAAAMILGHYYLVILDLPILALRKLTLLLVVALVLRGAVVGLALFGPVHAGLEGARLVASGLWSADGVFIWMRLLFGIAGPFSLIWFIWKTVELRSTQSATGILYVQLFLVLSGELLATYLWIAAGLPL
jgi:hypothetical protein